MLIMAYNDFIKAMKKNGVTPRSATPEEFFAQLMASYSFLKQDNKSGDLEVKHLMRLLGERQRRHGQVFAPSERVIVPMYNDFQTVIYFSFCWVRARVRLRSGDNAILRYGMNPYQHKRSSYNFMPRKVIVEKIRNI